MYLQNISGYLNDVIAMVGTLFLWLYWPSFNAALASVPIGDAAVEVPTEALASSQFLSIVNTLLSMLGSAVAAFAVSAITGKGRLNMMHVQNSTLAGGVAMGAACTLRMTPGGAIVVGTAAGVLSVCGYAYTTPYLDGLIGLGDTCGIHNLHGMPAILGGLVAGLAALGQDSSYLNYSTGGMQLGYQVVAIVVTMAIGISGEREVRWLLKGGKSFREHAVLDGGGVHVYLFVCSLSLSVYPHFSPSLSRLTGGLIVGYLMSVPYPASAHGLLPSEMFDDGVWCAGMSLSA